jgi:hypothetical protein
MHRGRRAACVPPIVAASVSTSSAFRPAAHAAAHGRPTSAPSSSPEERRGGGNATGDAQADVPLAERLRAQLAFKDSMVHGILQFTPSIAFRYVLHRCESRDIRCRESFCYVQHVVAAALGRPRDAGRAGIHGPWRNPRRGSLVPGRSLRPTREGGTNPGLGGQVPACAGP